MEDYKRLINAGFSRLSPSRFQRGDLIVERGSQSGDWYWAVAGNVLKLVPECLDPVGWIINDE